MIDAYDGTPHNDGARIETAPLPVNAAAKTSGATDMHVPSHPTAAELEEAKRIFAIARPQERHLAALAAARTGRLPPIPDFSAATHAPYRKRLAAIKAAITARDIATLEACIAAIRPASSSPRALFAFASLAAIALKASADEVGSSVSLPPAKARIVAETCDAFDAEVAANATHYTTSVFLGRGAYDTREWPCRAEALAQTRTIADERGKACMVYAVDKHRRTALLATIKPHPRKG